MSSKFESREDPAVVRNYGKLLVEMANTVPDGELNKINVGNHCHNVMPIFQVQQYTVYFKCSAKYYKLAIMIARQNFLYC